MALTNIVHIFLATGWTFFLGTRSDVDTYIIFHWDIVTLCGYDPTKQCVVVQKIKSFKGRIAHKAMMDTTKNSRTFGFLPMLKKVDMIDVRRYSTVHRHVSTLNVIIHYICARDGLMQSLSLSMCMFSI